MGWIGWVGADLGEDPVALLLVHHLDDADDGAADADGHAEDRLGHVAGLLIDPGVEPLVHVDIRHIEGLACPGHMARDSLPNREPVELGIYTARNVVRAAGYGFTLLRGIFTYL